MPEMLERTQSSRNPSPPYYSPSAVVDEMIDYPEQREDDMGESSTHYALVSKLVSMLKLFLADHSDVFISANLNLYFEEGNPNRWYAPDILIAFDVPNVPRKSYQIWKENKPPRVIFEVSSERTWQADVSEKLNIYGEVGVEEYYILDPDFEFLPAPFMAFHRRGDRLLTVPVENDRVLSPGLGLEIVRTDNDFRLFDPDSGEFLLTVEEYDEDRRLSIEREQQATQEIERLKAELARLRSEQ